MATTFDDIFPEYFTLYRGQATNIPTAGDPEYAIALQLAKASTRKWARTDGMEWNVLWKNFSDGGVTPIVDATYTYAVSDMRKPPKQITIGGSALPVIKPEQVDLVSQNCAWFTGSPSKGWTLHIRTITAEMVGQPIDFVYLKQPIEIVDGSSIIEMSDPTFLIHDMLAARFTNARNGFAVKVHKGEAMSALQNMKVEDISGTYGQSDNLNRSSNGSGFGVTRNASII